MFQGGQGLPYGFLQLLQQQACLVDVQLGNYRSLRRVIDENNPHRDRSQKSVAKVQTRRMSIV